MNKKLAKPCMDCTGICTRPIVGDARSQTRWQFEKQPWVWPFFLVFSCSHTSNNSHGTLDSWVPQGVPFILYIYQAWWWELYAKWFSKVNGRCLWSNPAAVLTLPFSLYPCTTKTRDPRDFPQVSRNLLGVRDGFHDTSWVLWSTDILLIINLSTVMD